MTPEKLTLKQISLKTTWSPEDEAEFFSATKRSRSDHARITMLMRRAKAIAGEYPKDAMRLLEMILSDYPKRADYQEREAVQQLAKLSVQVGDTVAGAERLREYAKNLLATDAANRYALLEYSSFVVEHACTEHYRGVLDLVSRAQHNRPTVPPDLTAGTGESWVAFCDASFCAHRLGDSKLCAEYLTKVKEWYVNEHRRARDTYRLWIFQQCRVGSRPIAPVVVRPEFSLAEMRDWVERTWTKFCPEIEYSETEKDERLILMWPEYAVDLILRESPKRAASALSFFRKKNLGKFDTVNARELKWKDAGDFDDPDAINISIQMLDYFQDDPRVAVDIG